MKKQEKTFLTLNAAMEFACKYFGSERVNFSRGKQIADLALNKLKTADQFANGKKIYN